MHHKMLITVLISLLSTITMAESISITVKPENGLSGTTSLTIHDDGNVTVLVYESAVKISENTVNIEAKEKDVLRMKTLSSVAGYFNQDSYDSLKTYTFTTSIAYTVDGVTKNISSKRLTKEAIELIKQLTKLVPGNSLHYVEEEIK
ncbi:MAG: hypothetical protein V7752_08255 [Halopseudomonas sp.]